MTDGLDKPRALLMQLCLDEHTSLAELSEYLGRNRAYLHQYVHRGSPRELKEGDRIKLGGKLRVTARSLLTGDLTRHDTPGAGIGDGDMVHVPTYEFKAGMGGGGIIVDQEPNGDFPLPSEYARRRRLHSAKLISFELEGDSMAPTLLSGDQAMANTLDKNPARGGIFAIFDGDTLVVKRIEKIPASDPVRLRLISDNEHHSAYDVLADDTDIIGRVVWFARRI